MNQNIEQYNENELIAIEGFIYYRILTRFVRYLKFNEIVYHSMSSSLSHNLEIIEWKLTSSYLSCAVLIFSYDYFFLQQTNLNFSHPQTTTTTAVTNKKTHFSRRSFIICRRRNVSTIIDKKTHQKGERNCL